jgi:hypothetical protein
MKDADGSKDPAARCAGSSYSIYELLKTSSEVSQETWMMDAESGGESDPSERPEAQSPIIQKNRKWNEQASGRPIEMTAKGPLHPPRARSNRRSARLQSGALSPDPRYHVFVWNKLPA